MSGPCAPSHSPRRPRRDTNRRRRSAMDAYIAKNDNHAATIEDFLSAMEEGNGVDLAGFRLWYRQAGTPEITVEDRYDPASRQYELTVAQPLAPTPGQARN